MMPTSIDCIAAAVQYQSIYTDQKLKGKSAFWPALYYNPDVP